MDHRVPLPEVHPSQVITSADLARGLDALRRRHNLAYEAIERHSTTLRERDGTRWEFLGRSTVGEILTGKRRPSRVKLITLLTICGVTPDDQQPWLAAWQRSSSAGASPLTPMGLPFHAAALIADKTRGFVGRGQVFDAIDRFIDGNVNGYFVLDGDPGAGKSAALAEYAKRHGHLAHFNQRAAGITSYRQFLDGIFQQLATRFVLSRTSIPPDAHNDGAFLIQMLHEASVNLPAGQRLVVVLDALDEGDPVGGDAGTNVFFLPAALPDNVYFLLSRRRADLPLSVAAPLAHFSLDGNTTSAKRDVATYIRANVQNYGLEAWLSRRSMGVDDFVAALVERSEGNFMYLRYMLPDIGAGLYDNLRLEVLPKGLEGYYEDHWRRMGMSAHPLPRTRIRIVYVLAEVKQPVSRRLIARFASDSPSIVDELTVQEVLDEWRQFLHEQGGESARFSLYHASFRDFLHRKDVVRAAGVTISDINALIAGDLWTSIFGSD